MESTVFYFLCFLRLLNFSKGSPQPLPGEYTVGCISVLLKPNNARGCRNEDLLSCFHIPLSPSFSWSYFSRTLVFMFQFMYKNTQSLWKQQILCKYSNKGEDVKISLILTNALTCFPCFWPIHPSCLYCPVCWLPEAFWEYEA